MTKRKMPTRNQIVKHWEGSSLDNGQYIKGQCFACGYPTRRLERAHITARVNGGTDSVDNLHMLCTGCHDESEYIEGEDYWRWYKYKIEREFDFGLRKIKAMCVAKGLMTADGRITKAGIEFCKENNIPIEEGLNNDKVVEF